MRNLLQLSIALFVSTTLEISALSTVTAADFGQQEVDQSKFVAIAVPRVGSTHQLTVLEQISDSQPCWQESGASPVTVDPLLLKFDFTGICGRSTDGNGYSLHMQGKEMGLLYKLKLVKQNDELMLVGISNTDPNAPMIKIGRTKGISAGLTKIFLESGWRFTKRTFNGKTLGHIYFTNEPVAPNSYPQQQEVSNSQSKPQEVDSTSPQSNNSEDNSSL